MGVVKPRFADRLHVRQVTGADWEWEWIGDEELNRRSGPLDEEWLEHVLSESDGVQFVVNVTDGRFR